MLLLYLLFFFFPLSSFTYKQHYSCRTSAPCGCSIQRAILTKIVGGETVRKRSWNWLVSLTTRANHEHFCGGSILSSSWILTAAHCVYDLYPSRIVIHAGLQTLNQSTQKRRVAKIVVHPDFDEVTYLNDIALLQLLSPLDMTDPDIAKICLHLKLATVSDPARGNVFIGEYPPINSTVIAIGWGQKTENVRESSKELQQVTLKTIAAENRSCRRLISSTKRQFCAGVEKGGKDTCQGDSGGPLMKFSSNRQWVLAGVTSFDHGCGQAEYAGIYTRVTSYTHWIFKIMNTNDLLTDSSKDAHETINDIVVDDSMTNSYSHCHRWTLLYMALAISLSLYFI